MDTQTLENLKEKSRKYSIVDGGGAGVMDGLGLRFIQPFAIAMEANNRVVGFLTAFPSLFGAFATLGTLRLMRQWTRKRIVTVGVTTQALLWLLVILAGLLYFRFDLRTQAPAVGLLITYTLLIMAGSFTGPVWNSWMKDLVTHDRAAFFGQRSRIVGFIALVCMLSASFFLDAVKGTHLYLGFTALFFIAFVARMVSLWALRKQYEPHFQHEESAYFTLLQFLHKMRHNNFGRFTIRAALFMVAVQIASPFFTVYMLKDLHFGYLQYTLIVLSASLSMMLTMPWWGRFVDKYGNLKAIKLSTMVTALTPLLWLVSTQFTDRGPRFIFIYLVCAQLLAGGLWGGYELGVGNFIFDAVTRQRLAICNSYFTILNATGILLGALLGGSLASHDFRFFGLSPLLFVFLVSGVVRIAAAALFHFQIKEVRTVEEFGFREAHEHLKKLAPWRLLEYFKPAQ
ncbi:MAG: MFS transporter [Fibrobacterota bacterium]